MQLYKAPESSSNTVLMHGVCRTPICGCVGNKVHAKVVQIRSKFSLAPWGFDGYFQYEIKG